MTDKTPIHPERGPAPEPGTSALRRASIWLWDALLEHIGKLIVGAIVFGVFAVFVMLRGVTTTEIKSYVTTTIANALSNDKSPITIALKRDIANELSNDKSPITVALRRAEARMRKSDAGAVNVGSFFLNKKNRSYTIYVYLPDGYKGELFYSLNGYLLKDCRYVTLSGEYNKPTRLKQENSIQLDKYFKQTSEQAELLHSIKKSYIMKSKNEVQQSYLRPLTFQINGVEFDDPRASKCPFDASVISAARLSSIEVRYVVLIAPSIRLGK